MVERAERRHLQRVPPHDLATEMDLLGAAMLSPEAAVICATECRTEDFYKASHKLIAGAIAQLVASESHVDTGTVAALLRHQGQLDAIRGDAATASGYLVELTAKVPHTGGAMTWAAYVVGYARRRRMLELTGDVVEAVYGNTDTSGLISEMAKATELDAAERAASWEPVNLAAVLAGEGVAAQPVYLLRSDGQALLYPGKVHAFNAEPEAGKTWLALVACVERMRAGEHVLYVDFEAGPSDIVERLLELGVTPEMLLDRFHYVRPDDPVDEGARLRVAEILRTWPITVGVIDGVAEALAMSGLDENNASDVTRFFTSLPRLIARTGAAVILVDHLVKERESQGRYARGSSAKLAGIDGAVFKLETRKPFGRGGTGIARVIVQKDRHGYIRQAAGAGVVLAEFRLRSDDDGVVVELHPVESSADGPFRPTRMMETISRALEGLANPVAKRTVRTLVSGTNSVKDAAVERLLAEGYIEAVKGGVRSLKPFRSEPEPEPDEEMEEREQF